MISIVERVMKICILFMFSVQNTNYFKLTTYCDVICFFFLLQIDVHESIDLLCKTIFVLEYLFSVIVSLSSRMWIIML